MRNHVSFIKQKFLVWFNTTRQVVQQLFQQIVSYCKSKITYQKYHKRQHYMLIGPKHAGKSMLMQSSGLHFITNPELDNLTKILSTQFPNYQYWLSNNSMYIEATLEPNEEFTSELKRICKFLRKQHKNKPLNGLIIAYSLADLFFATREQRHEFHNDLVHLIRDMQHQLKSEIPIYVVLTKVDQLRGFTEFFSDLSQEELTQIWGITIPQHLNQTIEQASNFYSTQLDNLYLNLTNRILWMMNHEKNLFNRELIYAFPEQFRLGQQPIIDLITHLLNLNRFSKTIRLRGIYLCSSMINGINYDALAHAIGTTTSENKLIKPPIINNESHFIQSLFYEVIIPEGKIHGDSLRAIIIRKYFQRFMHVFTPIVLILTSLFFYYGYSQNNHLMEITKLKVNYAHSLIAAMHVDNPDLAVTLPLLNTLTDLQGKFQEHSLTNYLFFSRHLVNHHIELAVQRSLSNYFLPRVAANLENQLKQFPQDTNISYVILKGYLAFSPINATSASSIVAPMLYQWASQAIPPYTLSELRYYLTLAALQPIEPLPLDRTLVNKIRNLLQKISPAERAYGMLLFKAITTDISNIYLFKQINIQQQNIFIATNSNAYIAGLYTRPGEESIFKKHVNFISQQVASDNQDIGLQENTPVSHLVQKIKQLYLYYYTKTWLDNLKNLNILSTSNLDTVISQLTLLSSNQSPLTKILNIINENTKSITEFYPIQIFNNTNAEVINYKNLLSAFIKLHSFLLEIKQDNDPDRAMFNATKNYMLGNKENPLIQYDLITQQSPILINRWLKTISNNVWNSLAQGSMRYINKMWTSQVIPEFNTQIRNRYPSAINSNNQISIDSFNHFFSPKGTLQQFLDNNILGFVNNVGDDWQIKTVNQHQLPLPLSLLIAVKRLTEIEHQFFAIDSNAASLNFTLQPVTLSASAAGFQLNIGNNTLKYQHGPRLITYINWLGSSSNLEAKAILENFHGERFVFNTNGPWSWFQLLQQSELIPIKDNSNYQLTITLGEAQAVFIMASTAPLRTWHLDSIKGFSLPEQL